LRAGVEWRATDRLRFGASGSTPMFMTHFSEYSGLLPDHGNFDIPAFLSAGAAYDILPNLTLMLDWKHIFYSGVKAMGNPSFPIYNFSFGLANGPGFDWRDSDSVAVAAEWKALDNLTLRAGYHYATNPIRSRAATFNVLAPAIGKHQASAGFNYQITKNTSIDVATVYVFKNWISSPENNPYVGFSAFPVFPLNVQPRYNPNGNITTWLRGFELSVGLTYKFDPGTTNWLPEHL